VDVVIRRIHSKIYDNLDELTIYEEIMLDVIRLLPTAQGYSESKGLFSARKAVMQHCQLLNIRNVTIEDIYLGNGASELIVMALQALLNNGDEVLIPAPDYPLWTAAVTCTLSSVHTTAPFSTGDPSTRSTGANGRRWDDSPPRERTPAWSVGLMILCTARIETVPPIRGACCFNGARRMANGRHHPPLSTLG